MSISLEVAEKLYTINEFLALEWPEDDENEYELIGGRIVAKTQGSTSGKHGKIVNLVGHYLEGFSGVTAGEKRLGTVFNGASCTLGQPAGENYPKPDVCFVLKDRIPDDFEGPIPVAPDLVVEVNSPGDSQERVHNKIEAYRQSGVKLVWSIYMLDKFLLVYQLDETKPRLLGLDDVLDGGTVLPGFELKVSKLFE